MSFVVAALSFVALPVQANSVALAGMPVPEGASAVTLVADVVRDGRLTSIARLAPSSGGEDVLDFYRRVWSPDGDDPGHREAQAGEWTVISRIVDDVLLVLQLRETGQGAEALMSAASLETVGVSSGASAELPPGGTLLSTTESRDGGRGAVTTIVAARERPGEVALFYRDRYVRAGWTLARDTVAEGASVLLFDRDGAHLEIVVSALSGGSVAVINEVRPDE